MLRTLKSVVFLALFFGAACVANAQGPLVQILWSSDYTLPSPVFQASSGGKMGGFLNYQITFPPPNHDYFPTPDYFVTDILLTDKSGLVSPLHIIDDNNNITGYPNLYPHENNILAGISSASKASFFTLANGDYTLTVCSALSGIPNGKLPNGSVNFTVADPCITATSPSAPDPIIWNPKGTTVQPLVIATPSKTSLVPGINPVMLVSSAEDIPYSSVPISVTVDGGCYKCKATVAVTIHAMFAIGNANVKLTKNVIITPGKNTINFYWDGNWVGFYGGAPVTLPAVAGAYFFEVRMAYDAGYHDNQELYDEPFSDMHSSYGYMYHPNVGPGNTTIDATRTFDDGQNAVYSLEYGIDNSLNYGGIPSNLSTLNEGRIDVYNGVTKILTRQLSPADVTDTTGRPSHKVNITLPSNTSGNVRFILSLRDSAAPFYDSHQSHYLSQIDWTLPAPAPGVYFDRSFIKVGHGPVSGKQTVNAYVTPYSAAQGMTFGTTKPYEVSVIASVGIPVHSGNAAVVPLTIIGQATGTPIGSPTGDCQITVNGQVSSGSPSVLVLIPTRLSKTHPQFPLQSVPGTRYKANSTTSPGDPITPPPNFTLWTGYIVPMKIQVWDQFGLNLDTIYTGAMVEESFDMNATWANINSAVLSDGTYKDPVVAVSIGGGIGPTSNTVLINYFLGLPLPQKPPDPNDYLATKPIPVPDLGIRIDGFNILTSGVIGRVLSSVAPDKIMIVWPDTP